MIKRFYAAFVLICFAVPVWPAVFGSIETGMIRDSNVYNDYSDLSDTGYTTLARLSWLQKIGQSTYPRIYYTFKSIDYSDYNLENKEFHNIVAVVKQRLNDVFTLKIDGGSSREDWPHATHFRLRRYHSGLSFLWYPLYLTECELGGEKEWETLPEYDLDNDAFRFYGTIKTGIGFNTDFGLSAAVTSRDYSERVLFESTYTSIGDLSSEFRKDSEINVVAWFEHYTKDHGSLRGGFRYVQFDSNDNEIYWGPYQTEFTNTTSGDELLVDDYWDYASRRIYAGYTIRSIFKIYFDVYSHFEVKSYKAWPTRDNADELKKSAVIRDDINTQISLQLKRYIYKNLSIITRLTYTNNTSNDYPYDYHSRDVFAGIALYF